MSDEPAYFPRKINVVIPLGESVCQFIVIGKDEIGALARITEVMAKHGVNLVSGGTYDAGTTGEFLFNFFGELAECDVSAEALSSELRTLPFVSRVSVSQGDEAVYDRQMFPVVLFENNRAVILTADSMTFIERDLQKQIGKQGQQVLFEVGRSSALSIAALHKNMIPEADRETLLKTACDDVREGLGARQLRGP